MSRTVVIGGVGPTLGESLARRFAREGDRVALWARTDGFTEPLAADLRAETDGDAVAVEADVTDPDAVEAGADAVRDAFGPVDVYVHNTPVAGWDGPADDPEALGAMLDTVGYGFALAVDAFLPDLRGGGTVIHNTGDAVKWVSRRMAEQLAPEGVHVVHAVVDGRIDGESVPDDVPRERRADPDAVAEEFHRLVAQDRDVWTFDVDFRPWGDDAFRTRR
jgi:NADP-dependent 3-hydroxy acid dehydrogenase YdfG